MTADQRRVRHGLSSSGPVVGSAPGTPIAQAVGVSKSFGASRALSNVSISITPGEIRGLIGRNGAGKSTLVGVLTGLLEPDEGRVLFNGEPAPSTAKREAWKTHVACVYQKTTVIPGLSVCENLFLNSYPDSSHGFLNWRAMRLRARTILSDWNLDLDIDQPAEMLSVEERQILEIARALAQGARFIILDEPTAQLEVHEIERLFERMRSLKESGLTFLYISHHLLEIFEICDSVAVLRDGVVVADEATSALTRDELVSLMVGAAERAERRGRAHVRRAAGPDEAVLEVNNLTSAEKFRNVSFSVAEGELLGLAGLGGSGKDEIAGVIVGLDRPDAGEIRIHGSKVATGSVGRMQRARVAFIPRDRHAMGFIPELGVGENLTLTVRDRVSTFGVISDRARSQIAGTLINGLEIKAASQNQTVAELSGGNQQKVVVGRALALEPDVLVMIGPTAGVDVAAKISLFEIIDRARDRGAACLMVSDELEELARCDRILVVFNGRITAEFSGNWNEETLVGAIEGVESDGD